MYPKQNGDLYWAVLEEIALDDMDQTAVYEKKYCGAMLSFVKKPGALL
jgi:hypothetical protein